MDMVVPETIDIVPILEEVEEGRVTGNALTHHVKTITSPGEPNVIDVRLDYSLVIFKCYRNFC